MAKNFLAFLVGLLLAWVLLFYASPASAEWVLNGTRRHLGTTNTTTLNCVIGLFGTQTSTSSGSFWTDNPSCNAGTATKWDFNSAGIHKLDYNGTIYGSGTYYPALAVFTCSEPGDTATRYECQTDPATGLPGCKKFVWNAPLCSWEEEFVGMSECQSHGVYCEPGHCFDQVKTAGSDEVGIDCGGSCAATCVNACPAGFFIDPVLGKCVSEGLPGYQGHTTPAYLGECPEGYVGAWNYPGWEEYITTCHATQDLTLVDPEYVNNDNTQYAEQEPLNEWNPRESGQESTVVTEQTLPDNTLERTIVKTETIKNEDNSVSIITTTTTEIYDVNNNLLSSNTTYNVQGTNPDTSSNTNSSMLSALNQISKNTAKTVNNTDSIKSGISGVKSSVDGLGSKVDGVKGSVDGLGDKLDGIGGALGAIDGKLNASPTEPTEPEDYTKEDALSEVPEKKDVGQLLNDALSQVPAFSWIDGTQINVAGGTCSVTGVVLGRSITFSLCDWAWFFQILGGILVGLAQIASLFLMFGD